MSAADDSKETIDLSALAERLNVLGMPSQSVIARESGVSQSTVSRASHGLIKTRSKGVRRLWDYADGRMHVIATGGGGSRPPPVASGNSRRRPRKRTSAAPAVSQDLSGMSKGELVELAVAGLEDYLSDAFDPLLVIEQISVLRRAQDRGSR